MWTELYCAAFCETNKKKNENNILVWAGNEEEEE